MTEKLRKKLITALKIIISAVLIYFIFTKIELKDVLQTLKKSDPLYLFFALLFFVVSKVIAAIRTNLYFHQIGAKVSQLSNLKLYLLGMFYNLFLPGGIGGDAYKGYVIQKEYQPGTKKVVSSLLLDRLSGMLLLFVYACMLAVLSKNEFFQSFYWLIIAAIPLSVVVFWFVNKMFFATTLPVFWKSVGFSALVQLTQLVCVIFILKSLSVDLDTIEYLFVFLVSSIVSVIPLTIGGIGSREVTFLYGAKWLGLDESTSIGISFTFFLITALTSLFGVIYHFKKPKLESVD
ncbi:lysylphosphatidylglycerol synthase transmembrane domain-containing protein [Flagellimonas okinawensis]|uniref:Lysylphosphatidylglycerol synthase transmembrane domain-containing protein n=1 Tax=Flagellimonas okinawensis TaxID=3031324 RepID=A0ABT5XKI4_9FLAO|nr:lysylphosphatidylglycerol synthase transmembrane domain-containing protein [[Muricauda] okinawensis]MDF0706401.1 lysylphosphatidylglycerol synthase transmembrane domain-containing protein [[Muricauda] okinawensis]